MMQKQGCEKRRQSDTESGAVEIYEWPLDTSRPAASVRLYMPPGSTPPLGLKVVWLTNESESGAEVT